MDVFKLVECRTFCAFTCDSSDWTCEDSSAREAARGLCGCVVVDASVNGGRVSLRKSTGSKVGSLKFGAGCASIGERVRERVCGVGEAILGVFAVFSESGVGESTVPYVYRR